MDTENIILDPRKNHQNCVMCGTDHPTGLKLKFKLNDDGSVSTEFSAPHELQGYDGILHGGVSSSLLDSAMTNCLFEHGIKAVTADLQIRYRHPVPCGAKLKIHAKIKNSHPPLYVMAAQIIQQDKILVHAKAKFIAID